MKEHKGVVYIFLKNTHNPQGAVSLLLLQRGAHYNCNTLRHFLDCFKFWYKKIIHISYDFQRLTVRMFTQMCN